MKTMRTILLLLAVLLVAAFPCNFIEKNIVHAQSISIIKGDVDADGRVTASDARIVLRASVSLDRLSAAQSILADVNDDGNITALDARFVLRVAVNLERVVIKSNQLLNDTLNCYELHNWYSDGTYEIILQAIEEPTEASLATT